MYNTDFPCLPTVEEFTADPLYSVLYYELLYIPVLILMSLYGFAMGLFIGFIWILAL
jgi:hypothetical protein